MRTLFILLLSLSACARTGAVQATASQTAVWTLQDLRLDHARVVDQVAAGLPLPGAEEPIFRRLTDLDRIDAAAAQLGADGCFEMVGMYAELTKLYARNSALLIPMTAAMLRATWIASERERARVSTEQLLATPSKRQAAVLLRRGTFRMVLGATMVASSTRMPPEEFAAIMGPVWTDAMSFLLPEEVDDVRTLLESMNGSGKDWKRIIAATKPGLPRHVWVDPLIEEHRAASPR